MSRLLFVDIETTGLRPEDGHRPWEIAVIDLHGNVLFHDAWQVDVSRAEEAALRIGRYYERLPSLSQVPPSVRGFAELTHDAVLAGASVHFDRHHLDVWLRELGWVPAWSHRVLDVCSWAGPKLGLLEPTGLAKTSEWLEIEVDHDQTHGALYDAWLAREVYLSVTHPPRPVADGDFSLYDELHVPWAALQAESVEGARS